jgi:hypothetical protein
VERGKNYTKRVKEWKRTKKGKKPFRSADQKIRVKSPNPRPRKTK